MEEERSREWEERTSRGYGSAEIKGTEPVKLGRKDTATKKRKRLDKGEKDKKMKKTEKIKRERKERKREDKTILISG